MYYDFYGDFMNSLEISLILNKMIDNTRVVMIDLNVTRLKNGLLIDKSRY